MHTWPAPAKLNLFLHITGQREDGYHFLQSIIQFVDLCDQLSFSLRKDHRISCQNSNLAILPEDELCVRAAQLLQQRLTTAAGVDIRVKKAIPTGAGMGGGSSDAATTLLALNQLWEVGLEQNELEALGGQLGADVPVFIRGQSCWVEGIGEQLSPISLPESWFVIVYPGVHLSTRAMFSDPDLTCSCVPLRMHDLVGADRVRDYDWLADTRNVFEPVACRHPVVRRALRRLSQHVPARLTGSGSALFARCELKLQANDIAKSCAEEFTTYVVKGLNQSPVISQDGDIMGC